MKIITTNFLCLFILFFFFLNCSQNQNSSNSSSYQDLSITKKQLQNVSLALNWFPEAEHGGYYAAKVHDNYQKYGLNVQILAGGPDVPVIQRVASGQIEFGVANADEVLLARNQGVPVVALLAPIQHTPMCIMVHEESPFHKLSDLKNVKLAMTLSSPYMSYLKKKLPLDGVTILPYSGNIAPFLNEKNYAQQGYIFSEPYLAKQKGINVRCLPLKEIGFDPYTSVLITNEKLIKKNPELVQKVTQASQKGWKTYFNNPKQTHEHIAKLNSNMNQDILNYGWKIIKGMGQNPLEKNFEIGKMTKQRWETLKSQLIEIQLIQKENVNIEQAFTNHFLK